MIAQLLIVAAIAVIATCIAGWCFNEMTVARLDRDIARLDRDAAADRLQKTAQRTTEVVIAVQTLIEKTDWMTGRWAGQFPTLVKMENDRNASVDKVRKALMEIPQVEELGWSMIRNGKLTFN